MEIAPALAVLLQQQTQHQQQTLTMMEHILRALTLLEDRDAGLQRQVRVLQDVWLQAPDRPLPPLETINGAALVRKECPDDDDAC